MTAHKWVCVDCLFALANGDYPEDEEDARAIREGEERELPYRWSLDGPATGEHAPECSACGGTGEDDEEPCSVCDGTGHVDEDEGADTIDFSWSACDCCTSTLGGSRHRAALIRLEDGETHKSVKRAGGAS